MNRRQFIFGTATVAAFVGVARDSHAECGEPTAVEFVGDLYERQAPLLATKTPLGEQEFYSLFARDLRQLMQAPRSLVDRSPDGPILNALFGWGVLPGTEVTIGKLALKSGKDYGPATVGVAIKYRGERHRILVHAVREDGAWRIANIIYDSGKSLLTHYRAITAYWRWRLTSLRASRIA